MGAEFKIGDRVVIKSWDEMVAEFGLNEWDSIACRCSFTENMKHLCGEEGIIKRIYAPNKTSAKVAISFCHADMKNEIVNWDFSTDMIKFPAISEEKWITDMYGKFLNDKNCYYIKYSLYTIVVNRKTLKSAVAKCSPHDNFNTIYGCAIAYARLVGEEIPNFNNYKELGNVGLFDKFKYNDSIYGIIGINPITKEVSVYDTSTGDTKCYKPDLIVEVIK